VFLDRNLDTSQPSGSHDPAPLLLTSAQAQVVSPKIVNFCRGARKAFFPSQGSQIGSPCTLIPRQSSSRSAYLHAGTLFCVLLQGVLRCPLVVGSRRIVVLHGKQEPFPKDIKRKCSLLFKAARYSENVYDPGWMLGLLC
jgi:hypothetical protein